MKRVVSVSTFMSLLCALSFFSATSEANERKGIGIFAGYNLASNIESRFVTGNGTETNVDYRSEGAFLFGARYAHLFDQGFGISGGLTFEFERDIDTIETEVDGGSISTSRVNDTYTVLSLEGNGYYHFYEGAYAIGGLNFSFPDISFDSDVSFRGDVGIQVGGGYVILPMLTAEILFKTQNFCIDSENIPSESEEARLWGVLLRVSYQIDLGDSFDMGF